MEVKVEVNSLRSWKLKWTIAFVAANSVVQREALNFLSALLA